MVIGISGLLGRELGLLELKLWALPVEPINGRDTSSVMGAPKVS